MEHCPRAWRLWFRPFLRPCRWTHGGGPLSTGVMPKRRLSDGAAETDVKAMDVELMI
jgi:hypothetical protein